MIEPTLRFWEVFFELRGLAATGPRQPRLCREGSWPVPRPAAVVCRARPRMRCWRADGPPRRASARLAYDRHRQQRAEHGGTTSTRRLSRASLELRAKCADNAEALAVLDQLAQEPEMHRRYSDYYAYEFFVARRG